MEIDTQLPSVEGSLDCSIENLERRLLTCLAEEQEKIRPDNALIAALCDAVRMGREYVEKQKELVKWTP